MRIENHLKHISELGLLVVSVEAVNVLRASSMLMEILFGPDRTNFPIE